MREFEKAEQGFQFVLNDKTENESKQTKAPKRFIVRRGESKVPTNNRNSNVNGQGDRMNGSEWKMVNLNKGYNNPKQKV